MSLTTLSRSVEGKVALITGAASGMGRATAELFAEQGAKVALMDVSVEQQSEVVDGIQEEGLVAHGWHLDVSDPEEVKARVLEVVDHYGGLDILVNNAGIGAGAEVDSEDFEETWDRAIATMLTAHVRLIRAALPHLRHSSSGRIVNIASTEGSGATKRVSPYTTAKTGVIGLTRSLAVELGREGITVNCICPGPIRTGMTANIEETNKREFARRRVALGRYAEPEEVAHMTLSLVLPAASFVTGVALPVDGGLTIKNA